MSRKSQLATIEKLLQRLDAAVVVREPGSARAAEAYEGLRKQIIQSGKSHRTHVAHLLSLSDSLDQGANIELIRDRVNDFMSEIGLRKYSDTSSRELFEITEGDGTGLECIKPAVIEQLEDGSNSVVRQGQAKRIPGPPDKVQDVVIATVDDQQVSNKQSVFRPTQLIVMLLVALIIGILIGRIVFNDNSSSIKSPSNSVVINTTTTTTLTTTTTVKP